MSSSEGEAEPHGICVVCQDALAEGGGGVTQQLECGHEFHTECILGWFRSLQSRCPLCSRTGGTYIAPEDDESAERAEMREIRRFAATPEAPQWLKVKLRALTQARAMLAEQNKRLAALRRQAVPADTTYAEASQRLRTACRKCWMYRRRVWITERFLRCRVRVSTSVITRQRNAPCRRSSRLAAVVT